MLHSLRWVFVFTILACLSGCGTSDIQVQGELHRGGAIYKPADGEQVMVTFQQLEDGQSTPNMFPTRLSADGTFQIEGPDNQGIPAGTYRVSVVSLPENPDSGTVIKDKFAGKYENDNSPLQYEVSSSQRFIKVEIE